MRSHRPLLILASLALLFTSVLSYNDAYPYPQPHHTDNKYGHSYGDYGNGYGNSRNSLDSRYGRPDLEIGAPASQPSACPDDVVVTEGIIIDIRSSVTFGALLLDGAMEQSFQSCVSRCCSTTGCDMALFKQAGLSVSDKNCYLVKCERPENCKMVQHDGFTCASVGSTSSTNTFGPGRENANPSPDREDQSQYPTRSRPTNPLTRPTLPLTHPTPPSTEGRATEQPLATVSTSSPATATTVSTGASTPSRTTNEESSQSSESPSDLDLTQESVTMPTAIDTGGSDSIATDPNLVPESDQAPTDGDEGDETSESDDSSESASGNNTGKDSSEAVNQGNQQRPVISKDKGSGSRDVCGESGCNGGGVIPVAVIGAISVVMLVVVVAIVLRRVVAIRRRRKFRNVDYLINGMYT